ncbi:uncharacterized protein [Penaeus vannamei]|uniref:uncharacterized protein n=1 Tax=Penaeus vannamei TaxID=6689 RepID=UPI00387F730F
MMTSYRFLFIATLILIVVAVYLRVQSDKSGVLSASDLEESLNKFQQYLQESLRWPERTDLNKMSEVPFQKGERETTEEVVILDKKCSLRTSLDSDKLYRYMEKVTAKCEMPVMVGGTARTKEPYIWNEKWMCLDARFNILPGKCLVYSFGISTDWSFDDDMDKRFNCKVNCFDHTIRKKDHNRSSNINFYATGIAAVKGAKYFHVIRIPYGPRVNIRGTRSNKRPWWYGPTAHPCASKPWFDLKLKVDRYINILRRLGHQNATIDYLKIDVEGAELQFFEDVFTKTPEVLNNIKQIGMEIHPGKSENRKKLYLRYIQLLECLGFKLIFSHILNVPQTQFREKGEVRSCCYELVWAQDRQW